ncbi:hypothetical protein [Metabacillus niabensis]|uniref:hypothetical protein n=1 Tax=Metabacillus niabensis TaxID=324854 RepID=UPI001CFB2C1D|nr:hypothetical protein [Metabacillus niabensis]
MGKRLIGIDTMVDLRKSMKLELEFIERYEALNKEHEFEFIFAHFAYLPLLSERAKDEEDWTTFKNYIASDFLCLEYPPCHIYANRDEVTAIWFIPDEFLINELGIEEQKLVVKNLERQLETLKLCKLKKLFPSGGDRDIEEVLYLEGYYRKEQFLKTLLNRRTEKASVSSAMGRT